MTKQDQARRLKRLQKMARRRRRVRVGDRHDSTGLIAWFLAQCVQLRKSKNWTKRTIRTSKRQLMQSGYDSKAHYRQVTGR